MTKTFVALGNVAAMIRHEAGILKPFEVIREIEAGRIPMNEKLPKQLKIHDVTFLQETYEAGALRITGPQMESLFDAIITLEGEVGEESILASDLLAQYQDQE